MQNFELIQKSVFIVKHMGEDVTFGRRYKDDEMKIMSHLGWCSETLKIEYNGVVILHQRFGQTHVTEYADPHPHILTYLLTDSGSEWYEHLLELFEAAKKEAEG